MELGCQVVDSVDAMCCERIFAGAAKGVNHEFTRMNANKISSGISFSIGEHR
jgi:hypothetical protein